MELKRCEMRQVDGEHEVTRLNAALDRQLFLSQQLQVRHVIPVQDTFAHSFAKY